MADGDNAHHWIKKGNKNKNSSSSRIQKQRHTGITVLQEKDNEVFKTAYFTERKKQIKNKTHTAGSKSLNLLYSFVQYWTDDFSLS